MNLRPNLKANEKRKKQKKLSWYKKRLWEVFAAWIKKRDGGNCFTCPATGCEGKNYHCGHFVKKSICGIELYFDERNNHGQCYNCNINLDGNQYIHGIRIGAETVSELEEIRRNTKGRVWTRADYEKKIEYYANLLETSEIKQ